MNISGMDGIDMDPPFSPGNDVSTLSLVGGLVLDGIKLLPYKTMNALWELKRVATVDDLAADISCRKCCSSLELNCFDVNKFIFFVLCTSVIPYITYQSVAEKLKWTELRKKTTSQHFETVVTAMASMTTLWFLGNYNNTFDWVTMLSTIAGILGFGYITEAEFARESLNTWRNWNGKMWSLMIGVIVVIGIFAVYHVYLAINMPNPYFWKAYVLCLLIPIALVYASYKVVEKQNADPTQKKGTLHVHHVHIFYVLAFFTRFPQLISRIAAGLVIGSSLHGATAYGYDTTFEHN